MNRRVAALTAATLVLALGGCQSTAGGSSGSGGSSSSGGSGGAPQGIGACTEDPADAYNPTALTIENHRIVARMTIECTGSVTPDSYYFQMILWKGGNPGPGVEFKTVPAAATPMTVSTVCSQGTFHVRFVVTGRWPDGSLLKGSRDQSSVDLPVKEIRLDDC